MQRIPSIIVPIDSITEAEFNYNQHDDNQIEHLDKSLEMFGQTKNVIVWHGQCIAGNGILRTAKQRGEVDIEVKDYSFLSEAQAKALLIADNATPALSYPDVPGLEALLEDIGEIEIPGCTEEWLAEIRDKDSSKTPNVQFKEYDESIADDIELCHCPTCGHEHARKKQ